MSHRYLEILDFTQFFDHFVFTPNAENCVRKGVKTRNSSECWNRTDSGSTCQEIKLYKIKGGEIIMEKEIVDGLIFKSGMTAKIINLNRNTLKRSNPLKLSNGFQKKWKR